MAEEVFESIGEDDGDIINRGRCFASNELIGLDLRSNDPVVVTVVEEAKLIMRQIFLVFLCCCFAIFSGCGDKKLASQTSKAAASASLLAPEDLGPAPDFILQTPKGESLSFAQFQGKAVLVDFWATWCPSCREEIPGFVDLYTRYKEKGVEIIGVSLDTTGPEGVQKFIEEFAVNYPVVMADEEIVKAYGGIRAIPTTFLVNPKGRIVKRYIGMHPAEEFERDISNLFLTPS